MVSKSVSEVSLIGKSSIYIDPDWNNPYLVFWHKYDFLGESMIIVQVDGRQEILKTFVKGSKSDDWRREILELNRYKGKDILLNFTADAEQHAVGGGFWGTNKFVRTEWYLQDIQIIPDY